MSSQEGSSSLLNHCCCCCSSYRECCHSLGEKKKKEQFSDIEYQVLSTSNLGKQAVESLSSRKGYVMPQEKSEVHYDLLQHHGSQETVSSSLKGSVIIQQPMGRDSTSSDSQGSVNIPHSVQRSETSDSFDEFSYSHHRAPLRRVASQKRRKESDVIDVTQSPTRSFSTAYHHSVGQSGSHTKSSNTKGAEKSKRQVDSPPRENAPEIDFLLFYNASSLSLTVHLQRARHLPPKLHKNYVILVYLVPKTQSGDTLQSKVLEDSTDPAINQSIVFRHLKPDEVRRQTLIFQLYNGSTMSALIGGVTLSLSDADLYGMNCSMKIDMDREKVKAVNRGDLLLSLSYDREANTLQGIVLKVTNLQRQDVIGRADIYIKIWLLHKGKRTKKWKSSVKQNTLTLVFNETLQFDLTGMNIHDVAMELVVMDRDRFSRDVQMGVVSVGKDVPHHTGKQHWGQVIAQPSVSISNWHPILPVTSSL